MKHLVTTPYIIILIFFSAISYAHSQCDCPGNIPTPMVSITSGAVNNARFMLDKSETFLSASYRYVYGNTKFHGDAKEENTFQLKHKFNIVSISAIRGINNRLNLSGDITYINSAAEDFYTKSQYDGLSLSLGAAYNLFSIDQDDEFIISAGGRTPLTTSILDTSGTSSLHNTSPALYVKAMYNYLITTNWNLILNIYKDYNFENNGIRQGDLLAANLMLKASRLANFSPYLSLDFNHYDRHKYNSEEVFSSGQNSVFTTMGLSYNFPRTFAYLGANLSIPLYRYYNGYQNAQNYYISLTFGVLF